MTLNFVAHRAVFASMQQAASSPGPGLQGSTRADQKQTWVQLAQSLKPKLVETNQPPRSLVKAIADPSRFLRWRIEDDRDVTPLERREYRKGDSFLLDFEGHRTGYLKFDVAGAGRSIDAPLRLRFTFGEVPGDVAEPLYPYHGELSSSWLPEDTVTIDFLPQTVALPRRYAFRFVKVEIVDTSPNYAAKFANVHAIAVSSALASGVILTGDHLAWIKRVDEVALATLRDCMQTTFEDGPRRDQRLWIGDLRLQARANYLTFKNAALVRRCLYLFAGLSRESDGYLPACVFEKPVPSTTETFIVDYAALYGAIILDYLRATGDQKTARDLWPVAKRQLDLLLVNVDDAGLFAVPTGSWAFIDWNAALDRTAAMQGVMIYCCQQLAELAELVGREAEVKDYPRLLLKMKAAARSAFYDASQGVCVSGEGHQISWASQAWLALSGCLTKEEAAHALRTAVLEDKSAIKPTTAYLYHHVVEAMIECGLKKEALALIRDYWGGMVEAGADTFWEAYDPGDSRFSPYGDVHINSFCHAWSCTPAYFFRANGGELLRT